MDMFAILRDVSILRRFLKALEVFVSRALVRV